MDAVNCAADIHGACAKWIAGTASHEARQIGLALNHFGGRKPVRPFRFALDCLYPGPGKTFAADSNSITDGLAATEHEVEIGIRGVDYDRAGRFTRRIIYDVTVQPCRNLIGCLGVIGDVRLPRCLSE